MRKLLTLISIFLLCVTVSSAQHGSGGAPDPFFLTYDGGYDTPTKTLRATQTLSPAVRNLVILATGQSNIADYMPSAYSPANPTKLDIFSVIDGATYAAVDPLVGCSWGGSTVIGNPVLRVADALVTANKFDRVVIVCLAVGGTNAIDWATGFLANKISVALARLAKRGMVAGTNITVVALWGQGEGDNAIGTSQANYTTYLNAIIANSRTAGFAGNWYIAKQTYVGGLGTSAAVRAAQVAVVNHGAGVWGGPDADGLVGTVCGGVDCRGGNPHFSDAGAAYYAGTSGADGWLQALAASGAPF